MPGLSPIAIAIWGCALLAGGVLLILNAAKLFGDWRRASNLGRIVRRLLGGPIVVRLAGMTWVVGGIALLALSFRSLISN
jgi:hypothetical protein